MRIDLSGKVALITGGGAGIGQACAKTLASTGARIVAVDINEANARTTVQELPGGLAVGCDVRDPESITAMRDQVLREVGGVDILVNCAGIILYSRGIGEVTLEEWDRLVEINLRGTHLVCQAFAENMKSRGWGKIVNFSSLAARVGGIEVGIHYTASKAALIGFSKSLAKELGPHGVCVNVVAPGVILTEPVKKQVLGHEEEYMKTLPLRRLGEPEDVANVIAFLASSMSDYVTGVVIDINGGIYMG